MSLDGTMILTHGGIVAVVASVLALGALRTNPRLFLKHFPAKVRETQPPLSRTEKTTGYLFAPPLFLALVGGPVISTLLAASWQGVPQDPASLWTHAFLVGMVFNLIDWLVLDELVLGVGKPKWALPPGVSVQDVTPFEHGRHSADFLKGVIFCAVIALIASVAALGATGMGWLDRSEM